MKIVGDLAWSRIVKGGRPPSEEMTSACTHSGHCLDAALAMTDMVMSLESEFRRDLDSRQTLDLVVRSTCAFYDGDWCGILNLQKDLDAWTPLHWYNAATDGMTDTEHFYEYEVITQYPQWKKAVEERTNICIRNLDQVAETYPMELKHYYRLQVRSVIAVPFYRGSTGFLVVRNPKRYMDYPTFMMQMVYVISSEIREYHLLQNSHNQLLADQIRNDHDVVINLFGGLEIMTKFGRIPSHEIALHKIAPIISILTLRRGRPLSAMAIDAALSQSCSDDSSYIKHQIYRFRQRYNGLFGKEELIISTPGGYMLNDQLHIMTDVEEFDRLQKNLVHINNLSARIHLLERIMHLYKGAMCSNYCTEQWAIGRFAQYEADFLNDMSELLHELDRSEDYLTIRDYAIEALEKSHHNEKMYYWLIVSQIETHKSSLVLTELRAVKKILDPDSYCSLVEHLQKRYSDLPIDV